IDAISFFVSAISVWLIQAPEAAAPGSMKQDMRREIAEGITVVLRHPLLRPTAACTLSREFFGGMYGPLVVPYIALDPGFGPGILGTIWAVGAVRRCSGRTRQPADWDRPGHDRGIAPVRFGDVPGSARTGSDSHRCVATDPSAGLWRWRSNPLPDQHGQPAAGDYAGAIAWPGQCEHGVPAARRDAGRLAARRAIGRGNRCAVDALSWRFRNSAFHTLAGALAAPCAARSSRCY